MANITLTNQTNSPVQIDTTHFGVGVATSATLVGTDLQIAEVYRDAGLGALAPAFTVQPSISLSEGVLTATYGGSGTPSYVWEISEDEDGTYVAIPGATGSTLAVEEGGWYRVVVTLTEPYGSATDQSAPLQVLA
jgi:hypothetical protein